MENEDFKRLLVVLLNVAEVTNTELLKSISEFNKNMDKLIKELKTIRAEFFSYWIITNLVILGIFWSMTN